jgi:phage shock protein A
MLYRFENAEKRIDRVESEAEAIAMGRNRNLADEIADLENDDRVEAELEELKSRVKGPEETKKPANDSKQEKK